jgi:hypothetical protein
MKAYAERGQRLDYTSYVDLRPAGDTNMEIRKAKANEVLHKLKDLFARCWDARRVRRLIKGVDYKVDRRMIWEYKHIFEALSQIDVTRLFLADVMIRVKT